MTDMSVDREMLLDWYDSHTTEPDLTETKSKIGLLNTFYPTGTTDILLAPVRW